MRLNRRVLNGTHGGVRGRGLFSPSYSILVRPKKISVKLALSPRFQRKNEAFFLFKRIF